MTTPTPSPGASLGRVTSSPRALAVWALLVWAALVLFFAFLLWIFPTSVSAFPGRSQGAFGTFAGIITIAVPVLAMLLAVHVEPALPEAKLVALIALIEYAFALLFGVLTFLIGLGSAFSELDDPDGAFYSFGEALAGIRYMVVGLVQLALLAIAMLVVYRAFTGLGGRLPINTTKSPPAA
jgi:hypothetical protein